MTLDQAKKFVDAVKAADIKEYCFFDDIQTRYYNNDNAFVIINDSDETLWNFRKALHTESREGIAVISNNIEDIRRAQIISDADHIKKFAESYGLSLTDDQLKILLILNNTNKEVMPITGDYHNVFHTISKESYDALSDEEKAEYDAKLKEESKRYDLPKGVAAQITL